MDGPPSFTTSRHTTFFTTANTCRLVKHQAVESASIVEAREIDRLSAFIASYLVLKLSCQCADRLALVIAFDNVCSRLKDFIMSGRSRAGTCRVRFVSLMSLSPLHQDARSHAHVASN